MPTVLQEITSHAIKISVHILEFMSKKELEDKGGIHIMELFIKRNTFADQDYARGILGKKSKVKESCSSK